MREHTNRKRHKHAQTNIIHMPSTTGPNTGPFFYAQNKEENMSQPAPKGTVLPDPRRSIDTPDIAPIENIDYEEAKK